MDWLHLGGVVLTKIIIRGVRGKRQEFVEYLNRHIPDAVWVWDEKFDAYDTFLRGLDEAGDEAAVHMEEDTILTVNFRQKLEAEIAKRPDNSINFFSLREKDISIGSRWDKKFGMNQCHYLPAGHSRLLAEYGRNVWEKEMDRQHRGYDTMMNDWYKSRKEAHWICCPNLVDHRVSRSLIDSRRGSTNRQSKTFVEPAE